MAFFRAMGALLIVLAAIYLLAWGAKRLRVPQRMRDGAPRLVSRISLGARSSLAVVEVEGERLVVGITAQQVSLLSRRPATAFDTFDEPASAEPPAGNPAGQGPFPSMLADQLRTLASQRSA